MYYSLVHWSHGWCLQLDSCFRQFLQPQYLSYVFLASIHAIFPSLFVWHVPWNSLSCLANSVAWLAYMNVLFRFVCSRSNFVSTFSFMDLLIFIVCSWPYVIFEHLVLNVTFLLTFLFPVFLLQQTRAMPRQVTSNMLYVEPCFSLVIAVDRRGRKFE